MLQEPRACRPAADCRGLNQAPPEAGGLTPPKHPHPNPQNLARGVRAASLLTLRWKECAGLSRTAQRGKSLNAEEGAGKEARVVSVRRTQSLLPAVGMEDSSTSQGLCIPLEAGKAMTMNMNMGSPLGPPDTPGAAA